jgi:hypothetical protein
VNVVFARWVSLLWGLVLLTSSCLVHGANYQDWWYNPNLSGMGLNIGQQDNNLFVTWFMYENSENPSFLLFYGDLDANQSLTAELHRYFGPEPPAYDETLWRGEVVGTVTIAFSSPTAGTFSYQYDGKAGSFPIERYTFHSINLSGTYHASDVGIDSNCGDDGRWSVRSLLSLTHNGTDLTGTVTDDLGVFYLDLTTTQRGSLFTASGSFTSNVFSGSFSMSNVRLIDGFLTFDYVAIDGAGCRTDGQTAAVRW